MFSTIHSSFYVPGNTDRIYIKNITKEDVDIRVSIDSYSKTILPITAETIAELCLCERNKNNVCKELTRYLRFEFSGRNLSMEAVNDVELRILNVNIRDQRQDDHLVELSFTMVVDRRYSDLAQYLNKTDPILGISFTNVQTFYCNGFWHHPGLTKIPCCTCKRRRYNLRPRDYETSPPDWENIMDKARSSRFLFLDWI